MQSLTGSFSLVFRVASCFVATCAVSCAAGTAAGDDASSTSVVIRGSTNLQPFVETWVEAYSQTPGAPVFDLEATGTGEGIEEFLAGGAQIAMASRSMTDEERSLAGERGIEVRETVVARMGIAVVVNSGNPVSSLTIETLADIFTGKTTSWAEVGGPDHPITVVRKTSGWSPDFFRERILRGADFSGGAVPVDSKEEVVEEVSTRPWAIGFTGMPEAVPALDRVHLVKIVKDDTGADSTYALSRPLFLYTSSECEASAPFLEFVLSPRAQEMIVDTGFYPAQQQDPVNSR